MTHSHYNVFHCCFLIPETVFIAVRHTCKPLVRSECPLSAHSFLTSAVRVGLIVRNTAASVQTKTKAWDTTDGQKHYAVLCSSRRCVNCGVYKEKAGETGLVFLTSKCKINSNDVSACFGSAAHEFTVLSQRNLLALKVTSDWAALHTSLHYWLLFSIKFCQNFKNVTAWVSSHYQQSM